MLFFEPAVFIREELLLERLLDHDAQFFYLERLRKIVACAFAHGRDRAVGCPKSGDHNHRRFRRKFTRFYNKVDSRLLRHLHVGDHQIDFVGF